MISRDNEKTFELDRVRVVTATLDHNVLLVEFDGDLDMHTSPQVRGVLNKMIGDGNNRLIVHLEGDRVPLMDTTGLTVLLGALKHARESNGKMALVCSNARVNKVLSISGLSNVLPTYDTVEDALKSFNGA